MSDFLHTHSSVEFCYPSNILNWFFLDVLLLFSLLNVLWIQNKQLWFENYIPINFRRRRTQNAPKRTFPFLLASILQNADTFIWNNRASRDKITNGNTCRKNVLSLCNDIVISKWPTRLSFLLVIRYSTFWRCWNGGGWSFLDRLG